MAQFHHKLHLQISWDDDFTKHGALIFQSIRFRLTDLLNEFLLIAENLVTEREQSMLGGYSIMRMILKVQLNQWLRFRGLKHIVTFFRPMKPADHLIV